MSSWGCCSSVPPGLGGGRSTAWLARGGDGRLRRAGSGRGDRRPHPAVCRGRRARRGRHLAGRGPGHGKRAGLLYAYGIRFLALAFGSIDAGLEKVAPSLTLAALSLGARPSRVVRWVHLPLLRPGIGVALVLVAVDALKELPIMLLLRPFGFETLAVWVNQPRPSLGGVGWATGADHRGSGRRPDHRHLPAHPGRRDVAGEWRGPAVVRGRGQRRMAPRPHWTG